MLGRALRIGALGLGVAWMAPGWALAADPAPTSAPARTRIGAFIVSLADISESQRRFEITFWAWLISPESIGDFDPAKSLEITNAAVVERQYAVTTATPGGRYSQVKLRASVRAPLDFRHFPFDRHTLEVHLEDAERDLRSLEFEADAPADGRPPLTASHELAPQDWAIGRLDLTVIENVEATNFGDPSHTGASAFSRATLHIDIARRHSLRILMTLLLGTFMSAFVAFFAVMLPIQQSPPRYTLLSSALFVCIANRLLVDARLPAGSSLGLVDQMQLLTILGLLVLTAISLRLTLLAEGKVPPARATHLSQRIGIAWLVVLVLLEFVAVIWHAASA